MDRIKSTFKYETDPILQRSNKYECKEPSERSYVKNYFNKLKQSEIVRPPSMRSRINSKCNAFAESKNDDQHKSKKLFTNSTYRKSEEMQIKARKVFPKSYIGNDVKNMIKEKTALDKEDPPLRTLRKIGPTLGKPSETLLKFNNKQLVPFETGGNKMMRRNLSCSKDLNTSKRIFTEQNNNSKYNKTNNTNNVNRAMSARYKAGYNSECSKDNLNELITYRYGPSFRDEGIPLKPTQSLRSFRSTANLTSASMVNESFLKPKKKFILSESLKKRIEKEIDLLSNLKDGMFFKSKEFDIGFYINVILDKRILDMEINSEDKNVPDFITFLMIVDASFPDAPPKILTKSNFIFPSLMDGRDLSYEICEEWNSNMSLLDAANSIPKFLTRVLSSKIYKFYGTFNLGAIYDLKNFNNMLVNTFNCKFEKPTSIAKKQQSYVINEESDYVLILSEDALILFENFENNPNSGKIVFWSSLYGITDLQVNKMQKIASINFYNDETLQERHLKLKIDNILFFREALVKRMTTLKVKVEAKKLIKGQAMEKRITDREINTMNITQIVQNINALKTKLDNNEINYYTVNTFTTLCAKAIEHYSAINDESHFTYLMLMKNMLQREDVQKITYDK